MILQRIVGAFALVLLGFVHADAATDVAKERAYLQKRITQAQNVIAYVDDCVTLANQGNLISYTEEWGCLPVPKDRLASWAIRKYLNDAPEGSDPKTYIQNYVRELTKESTRNVVVLIGVRALMERRIAETRKRLAALDAKPVAPPPRPVIAPSPRSVENDACLDGTGDWNSSVPDMHNGSVWHVRDNGGNLTATETGWGQARGKAEFDGQHLRIDFSVNNVTGYYDWDLDAGCTKGEGELVYTSGISGTHKSTVSR